MKIISFDVGLVHLAYVSVTVNENNWMVSQVIDAQIIDLTTLSHQRVSLKNCTLHHTRSVYDLLQHFFQEFEPELSGAEKVLIERQPLQGLVHVEQLLFGQFRSITELISPVSMHKYFRIGHLEYDQRKVETEKEALPWLSHLPVWNTAERRHDVADAWCLLQFWLHQQRQAQKEKEAATERKARFQKPLALNLQNLCRLRFNPNLSITADELAMVREPSNKKSRINITTTLAKQPRTPMIPLPPKNKTFLNRPPPFSPSTQQSNTPITVEGFFEQFRFKPTLTPNKNMSTINQ